MTKHTPTHPMKTTVSPCLNVSHETILLGMTKAIDAQCGQDKYFGFTRLGMTVGHALVAGTKRLGKTEIEGHFISIGPSRAGKSVMLNQLLMATLSQSEVQQR